MRRHSADEITSKVRQAEELMARGQSQAQACKVLGVSVMTFHRWRKLELARNSHPQAVVVSGDAPVVIDQEPKAGDADQIRMDELRLENDRLRRIVTDLLLEKMKLEERLADGAPDRLVRRGAQS